jgi:hypothetical protein
MAQVIIDRIVTQMHVTDGTLAPETLARLAQVVMQALQEDSAQRQRAEAERRTDNGFLQQLEGGGPR